MFYQKKMIGKKLRKIMYISKHNSNKEKQVILSMIPNREEWHYLPIKTYHYY